MMNLINNFSLILIFGSLLFLVAYPKIKLPIVVDVILFMGVISSFALITNTTYVSYQNAEIIFRLIVAFLIVIATYRQYKRSKTSGI